MDLMLVPVPLFNFHLDVDSYLFKYYIKKDGSQDDSSFDSLLIKALNSGGVEAFAGDKSLFVPIASNLLLCELDRQCKQPENRIIFLFEDQVPIQESHLFQITSLRNAGYRFAITNYKNHDEPSTLLGLCSYILLDQNTMEHPDRKSIITSYKQKNRNIEIIGTDVQLKEEFDLAIRDGISLCDGNFYRSIITSEAPPKITPLKANLIRLLNSVRDENFEFTTISEVVARDPALSVSLMRLVNSPFIGVKHKIKTIQHAVTILGQNEVRKWVTAAVFRSLGTDRPNELTRVSLVRAKYAENLADLFRMPNESKALFLMGLFSFLDVMLDTPMPKALDIVSVSDDIRFALANASGRYYPVFRFIQLHEYSCWDMLEKECATYRLKTKDVYTAYINAISWYNELASERVRPMR